MKRHSEDVTVIHNALHDFKKWTYLDVDLDAVESVVPLLVVPKINDDQVRIVPDDLVEYIPHANRPESPPCAVDDLKTSLWIIDVQSVSEPSGKRAFGSEGLSVRSGPPERENPVRILRLSNGKRCQLYIFIRIRRIDPFSTLLLDLVEISWAPVEPEEVSLILKRRNSKQTNDAFSNEKNDKQWNADKNEFFQSVSHPLKQRIDKRRQRAALSKDNQNPQ